MPLKETPRWDVLFSDKTDPWAAILPPEPGEQTPLQAQDREAHERRRRFFAEIGSLAMTGRNPEKLRTPAEEERRERKRTANRERYQEKQKAKGKTIQRYVKRIAL
jgi:hypothetical protein